MIVTIFRSRLNPDYAEEYASVAERIHALAEQQPGFVSIKTFVSEDGERLSLVQFDSWDSMHAWREHPDHLEAQTLGRERFYTEFSVTSFEN